MLAFQFFAQNGQSAVLAVPDGDHEIGAYEDHDLASLGDPARGLHGFVRHVVDRLEHDEQNVFVAFHFWALLCVHGVLDRNGMQIERLRDLGHLLFGRFAQAQPDECPLAALVEPANLLKCVGIGMGSRAPVSVEINRAVHNSLLDRFGSWYCGMGAEDLENSWLPGTFECHHHGSCITGDRFGALFPHRSVDVQHGVRDE